MVSVCDQHIRSSSLPTCSYGSICLALQEAQRPRSAAAGNFAIARVHHQRSAPAVSCDAWLCAFRFLGTTVVMGSDDLCERTERRVRLS